MALVSLPPPPAACVSYPPERYLRDAASYFIEGEAAVVARVIVVAFFCICALAQTVWGPMFNPFTPAHNVLYRVTGMPTPRALEAVSVAEKPKDD